LRITDAERRLRTMSRANLMRITRRRLAAALPFAGILSRSTPARAYPSAPGPIEM
jgi:hypothetical protein